MRQAFSIVQSTHPEPPDLRERRIRHLSDLLLAIYDEGERREQGEVAKARLADPATPAR
jgi:hypothetical protein